MTINKSTPGKMTKRQFLKTGLTGLGGFCLYGMLGCDRQTAPPPDAPRPQTNGASPEALPGHPAAWFKSLSNNRLQCELCPKRCKLDSGERGPCRVRKNVDGEGRTLAYANPALVQEDEIARKPFFHVLPGSRALAISTAGCNLACDFCEVWDMALVAPEDIHTYQMEPPRIVDKAESGGLPAVSYSFGEPVVFYEYMRDTAKEAKKRGMLNLLHTAGYVEPEPLKEIIPLMDAVNIDLKSFDPQFYRRVVEGELEPVLETIKLLVRANIHLEITNIQIPTLNDNPEELREMCKWLANEAGPGTPLHFARFYPLHRLSDLPQTPVSTLEKAHDIAQDEGMEFVYISRVTGHSAENTFCPSCGEKIIARTGFILDDLQVDEKGKCRHCDRQIPGRWNHPDKKKASS